MTHTLTFPGESAPAFPSVTLTLPDDWQALSVSGAVLAAGKTVEQGQFRPNVVVAVSRFGSDYSLQTAIDAVVARVASIPGVVELGREELEVLGTPGYRIEFSYPDERVGTLMQGVRIAVVENGPVTDLVQLTVTATGEQATELWGELREIQASATSAA
ncbi:LpqN/LpqT family lipoprotein [Herbiconiux solani]|uniref:LpqN/LpqT family lipoprotein n=1 Tax=Herbiconiux solani TaxID=661329 RepID=UPI000826A359|nr:LpqN/LpqT family lipoprotein [Herbiconiux solani]